MSTRDIIDGAEIADHRGAFVLGCFDTRITLYSQQVRALQLANALNAEHYLKAGKRVAVIGGGAAGMTMAAALALHQGAIVELFEGARELMPLQSASHRRRIDPHIYEWPKLTADHPRAELPILDWRSGAAAGVRQDLVSQFNEIQAWAGQRLRTHLGHAVMSASPRPPHFDILARRQSDGETVSMTVDYVVLAIGFGLESPNPIPSIRTESYWSDTGIPGPAIGMAHNPSFLVSGNGDGGLIDFVAAASADFDHWALVEAITRAPNVESLAADLLAIDEEARSVENRGQGFDFVRVYDERIGDRVEEIGLVGEIERLLRPGVQLVLQTRDAQPLMIHTATLNRLATYLVIRACRRSNGRSFRHVVAANVVATMNADGLDPSKQALDCDGSRIAVDKLIVRRGPDRGLIRSPFVELLGNFGSQHEAWIRYVAGDAIAPKLSEETHAHFVSLADAARLAPPRYRLAEFSAASPHRVGIAGRPPAIRWSGDVGIAEAVDVWDESGRSLYVQTDLIPAQLGSLAHSIARLAMHADRCVLCVNPAHWRRLLETLTVSSPHADGLVAPRIGSVDTEASIRNGTELDAAMMANRLDEAMDRWVLARIDDHLGPYLSRGNDPGSVVRMRAAADLRARMKVIWEVWRDRFRADAALLSRFLRLTICAKDLAGLVGEARAIVGPRTLKSLIRATAAALVVATGWETIVPSAGEPGNLTHGRSEGDRQGHACAAAMIDGEATALAAARYMWRTHFVLLPMEHGSVRAVVLANRPLNAMDGMIPSLRESDDPVAVILTLDAEFMAAASTGCTAVAELLARADASHYECLGQAIESVAGSHA